MKVWIDGEGRLIWVLTMMEQENLADVLQKRYKTDSIPRPEFVQNYGYFFDDKGDILYISHEGRSDIPIYFPKFCAFLVNRVREIDGPTKEVVVEVADPQLQEDHERLKKKYADNKATLLKKVQEWQDEKKALKEKVTGLEAQVEERKDYTSPDDYSKLEKGLEIALKTNIDGEVDDGLNKLGLTQELYEQVMEGMPEEERVSFQAWRSSIVYEYFKNELAKAQRELYTRRGR